MKPRSRPSQAFRALTELESLGPKQQTFLVTDNSSAPHLRPGEYAVVDIADRDLQNGEAYLIQWTGGERKRAVIQATADRHGWFVGVLRRFPTKEQAARIRAATRESGKVPVIGYTTDGPYEINDLKSRVIGRVVGVASAPMGELIAPSAGWENEDAGNAAFDPAEYVDALLAAGWQPVVFYGENGAVGYMEYTPAGVSLSRKPERQKKSERQSKKDEQAELAVRWKRCRASTGIERVKEECIRRGLVEGRRAAS